MKNQGFIGTAHIIAEQFKQSFAIERQCLKHVGTSASVSITDFN
jgi:hypothetical protein